MTDVVIAKMKDTFGSDTRRISHALEVLKYALMLCEAEFPNDPGLKKVVELAAILHDIGIKRAEELYNSAAPVYQHREGPPIARKMLEDAGYGEKMVGRVCHIIGNHHLKSSIDGTDFQLLWEADLLVNMRHLHVFKNSPDRYGKMVLHNFKTGTGRQLALDLHRQNSQ